MPGVTKERGKSWICKRRERERERERATRVSTDGKVEFQRASICPIRRAAYPNISFVRGRYTKIR